MGRFNDANQFPAGCSGKVETPQAPWRRGGSNDAPRKAKCLKRKSTIRFYLERKSIVQPI
ncbi:hypothetical protein D1B31_20060 [Neobacillus notoginsengisoli]|uniref:Uncharacterized protein n=1 Tax=Neobacillus notoginsengisoli TaxID=1578198 RepID=A0A417YKV8_9BACI|nr:hypothetical protein D1B31_20060 [Neobacillus notoginsengisoli]